MQGTSPTEGDAEGTTTTTTSLEAATTIAATNAMTAMNQTILPTTEKTRNENDMPVVAAAIDDANNGDTAKPYTSSSLDNNNDQVNNNNNQNNYFKINDELMSVASDQSDVAIADDDQGEDEDEIMNAAPMHLHALSRLTGDPRLLGSHTTSSGGGGGGGVSAMHHPSQRHQSPPHRRARSEGGVVGNVANDGGNTGSGQQQQHGLVVGGTVGIRRSRSSTRISRGAAAGAGATVSSTAGIRSNSNSSLRSCGSSSVGRQQQHSQYESANSTAFSGHSHASHDGGTIYFDSDLLLDRLGFIDLDPPLPHEIRCGPLAMPGNIDGKPNTAGGLTPVCERLSEDMLEDCHAFSDLASMPSVSQSSNSTERVVGMRGTSDTMSIGSLSIGSLTKGGGQSKGGGGGSLAGGSLMGDGENSVWLGTLDEEGEEDFD